MSRIITAQDYQAFYEEEILYRSLMDYPPVGGMLALHGQGEDESYLQMAMEYLKKYLDVLAKKTQARVIGPADESVSKVADIYRKVIYVRHGRKEVLDQIKERTEQYIEIKNMTPISGNRLSFIYFAFYSASF